MPVSFSISTLIITRKRLDRARTAFCRLIDRAIEFGGSYFLTYHHRYARPGSTAALLSGIPGFLRRKRAWDPEARLSSDWFKHYEALFS